MSPSDQAWGPWPDGGAQAPGQAPGAPGRPPGEATEPRPRTVGEILEGAIKTVLSGPRVLVGGALLVVGGVQLVVLAVVWLLAGDVAFTETDVATTNVTASEVARLATAAAVAVLGSWTVSVAMTGLGASAVAEWTRDRPITFASVVPRVRHRFGRLVLALIVAVAIPLGAALAVAVPTGFIAIAAGGVTAPIVVIAGALIALGVGVWLAIRLVLSPVAAVLGTGSTAAAIGESWRLTRRHFWRVLGFIALNALLTQTVTAVVAAPLAVIVSENPEAFSGAAVVGAAVTSAVAVTVTAPFTACVTALLFLDLRDRASSVGQQSLG